MSCTRWSYQFAVSSGTHAAFLLGSAIAIIAFVAAFFVKEVPLKGADPETKVPEAI